MFASKKKKPAAKALTLLPVLLIIYKKPKEGFSND